MMKSTFTVLFFFICAISSFATDYYVSNGSGNDNNAGTLASPFKTIQKAVSLAVPGDNIYVRQGEYREEVTVTNNGPLTIQAYGQETAVIKGTNLINNWALFRNGIYKAYAPDSVFQVFVNNEPAYEARYPDFDGGEMLSYNNWATVNATAYGNATFTGMSVPTGYWNGGYCAIWTGYQWVQLIGKISSSGGNAITCSKSSGPWNVSSYPAYLGAGKGVIYLNLHALTSDNEWHWQNDTLYYKPRNGQNANSLKIEGRTRLLGINSNNKSNITVKNLHFVASTVQFMNSTDCLLDGGSVWYPTSLFYYRVGFGRNGGTGVNHPDLKWDGKGVYISGNNNTVQNVYIAHSWGDGVGAVGTNLTVKNCLIENVDWAGNDCAGISTTGANNHILNNTVRKTGRSIIVHRQCNSTEIVSNNLSNCGIISKDLGVTYTYQTNGKGSQIAYNWVHDNKSTGFGVGIYLDNTDTAFRVHHNVIWNVGTAIQTNLPAVNHEIYNNTAWNVTYAMGTWGPSGTSIVNQIVKNNLSNKPWDKYTTASNNLVTTNPQFTNAAANNYTLAAGSPAIDYGTAIPGITDGFVGTNPDAGAYEYSAPWVAPGSTVSIPDLSAYILPPKTYTSTTTCKQLDLPFSGNANDVSGKSNNMTVSGAVLCPDRRGDANSAYLFDGINDYMASSTTGITVSDGFTITGWFNTTDLVTRRWIVGNRQTSTGSGLNYGIECTIINGTLNCFIAAAGGLGCPITTGWHFFAFSMTGNVMKLYLDGVLKGTTTSLSAVNNAYWTIGAARISTGWSRFFNGNIDDIRIYCDGVTDADVLSMYNGLKSAYIFSAVPEIDKNITTKVYPNPSADIFNYHVLNVGKQEVYMEITTMSGTPVLKKNLGNASVLQGNVSLSAYPSQVYFMRFITEKGELISIHKLIKLGK